MAETDQENSGLSVETVLRVIGAGLSIMVIAFVTAVGVMVYDGIMNGVTHNSLYFAGLIFFVCICVILYLLSRDTKHEPPEKRTCELCGDEIGGQEPHLPIQERRNITYDDPWPLGTTEKTIHATAGYAHVACLE